MGTPPSVLSLRVEDSESLACPYSRILERLHGRLAACPADASAIDVALSARHNWHFISNS
jgi:hypothetical protein